MLEKIEKIWVNSIKSDYEAELINSEKSLQAILYMHLRTVFSKDVFKIFVEPRIFLEKDKKTFIPDIIICNKDKIAYIFEIKYSPHGWPKFERDLSKFIDLSKGGNIDHKIDVLGPQYSYKSKIWEPPMPKFKITIDTVYVFAVVGRYDSVAISSDKIIEQLERSGKYKDIRELKLYLLKGITRPEETEIEKRYSFKTEHFLKSIEKYESNKTSELP